MNKEIIIALCAGEASGDLLGAHLIDALKQQYNNIRFVGIGGPRMKAAGLISLEEQEPLAVRGYVEVLGNLSTILKIRRHLVDELKKISPHVFVGIDSPNFNLPVAEKLKAAGIPTLHYVSPSVWAWKPERVHKIVKQVNKVLCLFPMEPKLYRDAGGQAEYVGHPLAQMLPMENSREAVRERLKLGLTTPVFTLLPGSRLSEVDYMTPVFLRAAALIVRDLPESVFLMPYPSAGVRERLQHFLKQDEFRSLPIRLQAAKTELACMAADVVLVTSGTASLEVALCKRPMVISYKISPFTYSLVRRKIKIPYVGLPNILLNKMVVPELLQNNATPEKLATAVLDWYYHPARAAELEQQFVQLHQRLKRNTDELAAYEVLTEAGLRLSKPVAEGEDETVAEPDADTTSTQPETKPLVSTPSSEPATESVQTITQAETVNDAPLLIPPPSIVMGNISNTAVDKSTEVTTELAAIQPVASETAHTAETVAEAIHHSKNETQYNELDMNKVKRKSGLFGWLSSLFGGNKPVINERHATHVSEHDDISNTSDTSIVAVSRADNTDVETNVPKISTPQATPAPINLPKSGVLAQQSSKPNIFSKYMPENQENETADNPTPAPVATPSTTPTQSAPSHHTQSVNRPALKVKVTAVVRQPEERTNVEAAQTTAPVEPTSTPDVAPSQVEAPVAPQPSQPLTPPVGALANYINQASMAFLPESMKHPVPTTPAIHTPPATPDVVSVASEPAPVASVAVVDENAVDVTELVSTVEPIVQETKVPEAELPIAEEILAQQSETVTMPAVEAPKPAPKLTIQIAPKQTAVQSEPVISAVEVPSSHTMSEPVIPTVDAQTITHRVSESIVVPTVDVQVSHVTPEPVISTVEVQTINHSTPEPVVSSIDIQTDTPAAEPSKPLATPNVQNSFASVFRRHTLQTEQADSEDEAHNIAEASETDEPAQIVLNRSEAMTGTPTQAAQADAPSEEGLPAPSVSSYSSNPNRYNHGIFF